MSSDTPSDTPTAPSPMSGEADWLTGLFDALRDGLVALDAQGMVRVSNSVAEEILGISADAVRGRPLASLSPLGGSLATLARRVTVEGRAVRDLQVINPQSGRTLDAWAAPWLDRRGRPGGVVLLLHERPGTAPAESAQLVDDVGGYATLMAGLAHEVRNPLGGIRGAAQLLEAELPPHSPLREHTLVVIREVDRLAHLVQRLLALGRPSSGARATLNVHRILDEVLAVCLRDPRFKAVRAERSYDPSLPPLDGDADDLARLFQNLVCNAVEATQGTGRVLIETRVETGFRLRASAGGEGRGRVVLRISVADDGPGVPPALIPRLFTPFATGKKEGTGLGLALAQKVARDHGGWITLENRPGEGATFHVYLPGGEGR